MESESDIDPVVEYYKQFVDHTLLEENLKLTGEQRFEKFVRVQKMVEELRRAGEEFRKARD